VPNILTARLLLRPVQPSDRDELHCLEQDPEVMRHLNGGAPTPLEPINPGTSPYLMPRGGEREVWAVVLRDSQTLVGWAALFVDDDGTGELGYRFFRTYWGRGYATEAAKGIISDAFTRVGVVRIKAVTMAVNTRSRRVMEKLGMWHAETRFVDSPDPLPGVEQGEVEYVIERVPGVPDRDPGPPA
jgi:RimJ/RimL family protein N-acetyltransferase